MTVLALAGAASALPLDLGWLRQRLPASPGEKRRDVEDHVRNPLTLT